jgi:uncharacterized protein YqcC (DUF446 family)
MPTYEAVEAKINAVETEMKQAGLWSDTPPEPEKLQITQAFGGDKLSFEQWLQFVFVPRVRDIIATRGQFPAQNQVYQKAYREWRMWGEMPGVDGLLGALGEFDALFSAAET